MRISKIIPLDSIDAIEVDTKNTGTTADVAGDVVVIDVADLNNRSTKKVATAGSTLVAGIRKEKVDVGKVGAIYVAGIVPANVITDATTSIAVGDILATSTTAGRLAKGTTGGFAVALEAVPVSTQKSIKVKIL